MRRRSEEGVMGEVRAEEDERAKEVMSGDWKTWPGVCPDTRHHDSSGQSEEHLLAMCAQRALAEEAQVMLHSSDQLLS